MNVKNNINLNYLGSKETLLSFIETSIKRNNPNGINSFCDLFSGSGIVARHFAKQNIKVLQMT